MRAFVHLCSLTECDMYVCKYKMYYILQTLNKNKNMCFLKNLWKVNKKIVNPID